jgi:hypothetical protein
MARQLCVAAAAVGSRSDLRAYCDTGGSLEMLPRADTGWRGGWE